MTLSHFKVSCFPKFFFVKVECGNTATRETYVLWLKNGHEPDRPSGYYSELVRNVSKTSVSHCYCGGFAQSSISSIGRRLLPGRVSRRDHCAPLNYRRQLVRAMWGEFRTGGYSNNKLVRLDDQRPQRKKATHIPTLRRSFYRVVILLRDP